MEKFNYVARWLTHALEIWREASYTILKPIELLSWKIIKIIYKQPYYYPTEVLYKMNDLLTLRQKIYCKFNKITLKF